MRESPFPKTFDQWVAKPIRARLTTFSSGLPAKASIPQKPLENA
jgi:hypothetical protein